MPSLKHTSFNICQTFRCETCHRDWDTSLVLPLVGGYHNQTLETALKRSLYASDSVLFGNLSIDDLHIDEQQLKKKIYAYQEEIRIRCKRKSDLCNRTCPSCLYPSAESSFLDDSASERMSGYTILIPSLVIPDTPPSSNDVLKPSVEDSGMLTSPLSINPPDVDAPDPPTFSFNIAMPDVEAPSPQDTLKSSKPGTPKPAPRTSLMPLQSNNRLVNEGISLRSHDTTYPLSTLGCAISHHSSSSDYTDPGIQSIPPPIASRHPSTLQKPRSPENTDDIYLTPTPPLPPKVVKAWDPLLNLFSCTDPSHIRAAMRNMGVDGVYALVKSPMAAGERVRTPYIIFCDRLKDGYKTIIEYDVTESKRFFIHRDRVFESVKSLLLFYKYQPTKCNAFFRTQLTNADLTNYFNRISNASS